jgi:hypothetical protein
MTLTMNRKLLQVLIAIKSRQELAINESILGLEENWTKALRKYINALPDELIAQVGLAKNEFCIRAIESLTIPDAWLSLEDKGLKHFTFKY